MTNVGWVIGPLLGSLCSGPRWSHNVLDLRSNRCFALLHFFILYKVRLIEGEAINKKCSVRSCWETDHRNHSNNTLCLIILLDLFILLLWQIFIKHNTGAYCNIWQGNHLPNYYVADGNKCAFCNFTQIPLGSRVSKDNVVLSSFIGSCSLIIGVMLFAGSFGHLTMWVTGMIFFTLGEVLLNPVQYLMLIL